MAYICFVLGIATVALNALALKTIYDRRKGLKTQQIVIARLSCTDAFTGAVSLPAFGILNLNLAVKSKTCPLVLTTMICTKCGQLLKISTLSLAILEVYFSIFEPYLNDARGKKRLLGTKAMVAVWIFCTIIITTGLVIPSFMLYRVALQTQIIDIIPLTIILIIKAYLIVRSINNQAKPQGETKDLKGKRNNAKAARVTGIIVTAMCLCYFPELFASMIRDIFEHDTANMIIFQTRLLVLSSSTITPFIYCIQLHSFRKDLWKLISQKKSRGSKDTSNSMKAIYSMIVPV